VLLSAVLSVLISSFACRTFTRFGQSFADGFLLNYEWNVWLSIPIALGWAAIVILLLEPKGYAQLPFCLAHRFHCASAILFRAAAFSAVCGLALRC
jgi:hypothetical protein